MKNFYLLNIKWFYFLGFILFTLQGCQKDDSNGTEDESIYEDPNNSSGRFSEFITCSIISPPNEVGLSSYYKKYINCSGIPIIGNADVPDEALQIASETVEFMLTGLGNVRNKLISDGNYVALYPEGGSIGDLPENFTNNGNTGNYTNNNTLKAAASDVASLLCRPEAGYGHTLVHEIAHMIDGGALRFISPASQSELSNLYNQAISSGKWNNTYASTNPQEYLAEGVTIWYGVNWIGPEGGDGLRNEIGTRGQLQIYDSGLYNFINNYFNNKTAVPGCREPVISGTTANCPPTITDIDGNEYEIVNIGPMCWMKENLKTTHYRDGSPIQNITDDGQWQNTTSGAWSQYDNDPAIAAIYGNLYNGYALSDTRNICPEGWHVPSYEELQDMINYAGGDHASVNLRSTNLWNPPGLPATNSSGFTALPSGIRNEAGFFQELERRTNIGSKTTPSQNTNNFYTKAFFADQAYVFTENTSKNRGVPCRCVKD